MPLHIQPVFMINFSGPLQNSNFIDTYMNNEIALLKKGLKILTFIKFKVSWIFKGHYRPYISNILNTYVYIFFFHSW